MAVARQLGAEAVSEPRVDRAMLLAREAVNLNRDPQTEGTRLGTRLRSPAAIGTFTVPIDAGPQNSALRPDGAELAVDDNTGKIRFYNPRTHQETVKPMTGSGSTGPPTPRRFARRLWRGRQEASGRRRPRRAQSASLGPAAF